MSNGRRVGMCVENFFCPMVRSCFSLLCFSCCWSLVNGEGTWSLGHVNSLQEHSSIVLTCNYRDCGELEDRLRRNLIYD